MVVINQFVCVALSPLEPSAGRPPFQAEAVLGLYEAIQRAPLVQPADVPASTQLRTLLDALLAKNPAARPGPEQIAAHAWVSKGGAAPLAVPTVPALRNRCTLLSRLRGYNLGANTGNTSFVCNAGGAV